LSIEATNTGHPIIRPTAYHFQNDPLTHNQSFDFLLGPYLLVSSVYEPGALNRKVYLPQTESKKRWCNVWDGVWYEGGQEILVDVPLHKHGSLFAIEGAIIPINPVPGNCINSLEDVQRNVWIFPGRQSSGESTYTVSDDIGLEKIPLFFKFKITIQWDLEEVKVSVNILESKYKPGYDSMIFILPEGDLRIIRILGKMSTTKIKNMLFFE
jgi:alpha-glucosidase